MPTNRKVIDFKIHNLTEEQFQELKEAGQIDPNAIYCTPDETVANFEAVNARIDETNKKLNTFESGVNETVGVINTTIVNVDKKVDEAIQTEQQHNIEINARVDKTDDKLDKKVSVVQGEENAGKVLVVNEDGEVVPDKPKVGASLPILTHVFADHKLNDISWLNADTFSWQSGNVYVAAYEHLVSDLFQKGYAWQYQPAQGGQIGYTQSETPEVGQYLYTDGNKNLITEVGSGYLVVQNYKTGDSQRFERIDADIESTNMFAEHETDTVDDITVTFYRAEDGHKICLADQEANVQRLYDWMGIAWYYILDTENKRFKLPRTKHAFTGLRDSVGGYVKAGLPNITGTFYGQQAALTSGGGAFFTGNNPYGSTVASGSANNAMRFDASRSSSVYGNSNTVQPEATQMYLYFYVGNFEREALEQTAGITSEMFNNKADVSRVQELENTTAELENKTRHVVVEYQAPSSSNKTTWFRIYSDGWVEQGGTKTVGIKTITLPIVMKNNGYQGQVTGGDNNYGINYIMRDLTTTSCVVTARTTGGQDFDNWYGYWRVSGMAA